MRESTAGRRPVTRILGLDPGLARLGFGVLDCAGGKFRVVAAGTFESGKDLGTGERLVRLHRLLDRLVKKHKPTVAALEALFFSKNVKTAMQVGEARGVCLFLLGKRGVPVFEYKPNEVKRAVTGYGLADKRQVQRMVQAILGLKEPPRPDDTADALAVALTHAQSAAYFRLQGERNA